MSDVSQKRHIAKTITWRVVASTTTFILAWFFFQDDPLVAEKATGVAIAETIIKMALYYLHERVWYRVDFGVSGRGNKAPDQ